MYSFKLAATAAAFAAIFAMQSASAGAAPHRMPADYGQPQPIYQLKIDATPVAGAPIVIALVDRDGNTVRGGEVAMFHAVNRGIKAAPMTQFVPVALTRNADGSFVCEEDHYPGERLTLRGTGSGGASPVWLTVAVSR
jgi:hypothetical protein